MPIRHNTLTTELPGGTLVGADEWDEGHVVDESIDFPVVSTAPTPLTDFLRVYAQRRANRSLLRMRGQSGLEVALQPALFGNDIRLWHPNTTTTVGVIGQGALTAMNSGTGAAVATPAPANTNDMTRLRRFQLGTGTTATGSCGVRDAFLTFLRGDTPGRGGFFHHARFGVEVGAADIQVMLGMTANTANLAGNPSAFLNSAMIGKDTTDTNWQFMHNDGTGACVKFNTGVAVTVGQILDFFMFAPPNGASIFFELRDPFTGAVLSSYEATTDLPVASTFMACRANIRAPTSTTAQILSIARVYNETDI